MPKPGRSIDDLPLAAYSTGVDPETEPVMEPADGPDAMADDPRPASAAGPSAPAPADAQGVAVGDAALGDAGAAPASGGAITRLTAFARRNPRPVAGAAFVGLIAFGLVLLGAGGASPAATAATATHGPTPVPTIAPPSGEASLALTGSTTGTFSLAGLTGGQHVAASGVELAWGDAEGQTILSIAGPLDRGTRTTDERLVLTIGALVDGQPVTFTSTAGECTVGMAQVGLAVQGSFTCHELASADGKLTIEASGTYRS